MCISKFRLKPELSTCDADISCSQLEWYCFSFLLFFFMFLFLKWRQSKLCLAMTKSNWVPISESYSNYSKIYWDKETAETHRKKKKKSETFLNQVKYQVKDFLLFWSASLMECFIYLLAYYFIFIVLFFICLVLSSFPNRPCLLWIC